MKFTKLAFAFWAACLLVSPSQAAIDDTAITEIRAEIALNGSASVIVEMALPSRSERLQSGPEVLPTTTVERAAEVARMQSDIAVASKSLAAELTARDIVMERTYENLPLFVTTVDVEKLERLMLMPEIRAISLNRRVLHQASRFAKIEIVRPEVTAPPVAPSNESSAQAERTAVAADVDRDRPTDVNSNRYVNAEAAWARGYTGRGQAVVILDSGIEGTHSVFTGKILTEACFSDTTKTSEISLCPNGTNSQTGIGAARGCGLAGSCEHGTHVASTAVGGLGTYSTGLLRGVAPDAQLIPIQVFTVSRDTEYCEGQSQCIFSYTSATLGALNYVISLATRYDIAAVNMSLGSGAVTGACDTDLRKLPIDSLRTLGVLTTISAGNNGYVGQLSRPGCISTAITVSASIITVPDADRNHASNVDILAPGYLVIGAIANNGYKSMTGTSMSAPHVAGAIAVLKSAFPKSSAAEVEAALKTGGIPTTWSTWSWSTPRLDVNASVTLLGTGQGPKGTAIASVLPSADTRAISLLRLYNPASTVGVVTIELYSDNTGQKLGTWTKSIPANASPQIYLSEIERDATPRIVSRADDSYSLYVDAAFAGFVQHVMWNPQGPYLTNVAACENGLSFAGDRYLGNVHTSIINGYPSYVLVHNNGNTPAKPNFTVYDSNTGSRLGTFTTTNSVLAHTSSLIYASGLMEFFGRTPIAGQNHINVVLDSSFNGFTQHLIDNELSGMLVNMTPKCDM